MSSGRTDNTVSPNNNYQIPIIARNTNTQDSSQILGTSLPTVLPSSVRTESLKPSRNSISHPVSSFHDYQQAAGQSTKRSSLSPNNSTNNLSLKTMSTPPTNTANNAFVQMALGTSPMQTPTLDKKRMNYPYEQRTGCWGAVTGAIAKFKRKYLRQVTIMIVVSLSNSETNDI